MPDILPPQLTGVQQRPLYVKLRFVLTGVSAVWLILAIAGYGSFSGGTTSLALSLTLMYGTGIAILVVASALYRLLKRSALRRTESAPQDTAAAVFLDTTRSATEELLEALAPSRAQGRPASVLRTAPAARREAAAQGPDEKPAARQANPSAKAGSNPAKPKAGAGAASKPVKPKAPVKAGPNPAKPPVKAGPNPAKPPVKSAVNKKAAAKKKKGSGKSPKAPASSSAQPRDPGLKQAA